MPLGLLTLCFSGSDACFLPCHRGSVVVDRRVCPINNEQEQEKGQKFDLSDKFRLR